MKRLKTTVSIIMVLIFCTTAYPQEGAVAGQDRAAAAQEDKLLPIYKEGWQFFVAPYVWVPGG